MDLTRSKNDDDRPEKTFADRRVDRPLSPDLQAHIGVRLKAFYDSVLSEPIPDRFAELLDRLDSADATKSGAGAKDGGGMAAAAQARDVKATGLDSDTELNGGSETDVRQ